MADAINPWDALVEQIRGAAVACEDLLHRLVEEGRVSGEDRDAIAAAVEQVATPLTALAKLASERAVAGWTKAMTAAEEMTT